MTVVCLPLALTASLSAEAGSFGREADRNAWLNTLVGPVTGPGGAAAIGELAPGTAVLPAGGDLQVLVITQGSEDTPPGIQTSTTQTGDTTVTSALTSSGIPVRVLKAYVAAAQTMAAQQPACRITWPLLAGIGRVESNHARFGGAGIDADGRIAPPILGPRLDGRNPGWATIRDSDRGRYDGDTAYDRAVGPMQFLPGTWVAYARDADGNGTIDPQDVDDAALAAARYLCSGGEDLSTQRGRWNAVFRYNRSSSYVQLVLGLADSYASGRAQPVPNPQPGPVGPLPEPPASPEQPPPGLDPTPTPTPKPTPTPTPTPTKPTPTPTPTGPSPSPTSPSPSPSPSSPSPSPSSPSPSPSSPSPSPSSPSPTPTVTPTPTPTPTPTETPTPTPTPTPTETQPATPTGSQSDPAPTSAPPAEPPPEPATTTASVTSDPPPEPTSAPADASPAASSASVTDSPSP